VKLQDLKTERQQGQGEQVGRVVRTGTENREAEYFSFVLHGMSM
jgi:hypothetical protein